MLCSAPKPALELRAFAKTRMLAPGESQTLSFTLGPRDLASFDEASSSWLAEAGSYTVKVGASSEDIEKVLTIGVHGPGRLAVAIVGGA